MLRLDVEPRGNPKEIVRIRKQIAGLLRLEDWLDTDIQDVVLAVNEIMTNAFMHGSPPYAVHGVFNGNAIVRVRDGDAQHVPEVKPLDVRSDHGRGLRIVQAIATSWTTVVDGTGKTIIARFERSG
jgi:hypothetical protein